MARSAGRYDVIVVGARCAGSPLAALLAGRGLRVLLLDKADPSTDTPSTHLIQGSGVQVLQRLGVYDELAGLTEPIARVRLAFGDIRVESCDLLPAFGGAPGINVRRPTLDPVLVRCADAAGAEVRTDEAVTGLLLDHRGRVTGVVTRRGELRAGLVVGADGVRSTVARLVGASTYLTTPVERAFLWGYFDGTTRPAATAWFGNIGGTGYLASPTDGDHFMAAVALSRSEWPAAKRDLDAAFYSRIVNWPELADVLGGSGRSGSRQVGGWRVMAHGNGYFRESAGPGWVLVGDAGHFKDPTPGQGISDALRQVERLAPAVEAALDGRGDPALTNWWRWRDRDAMDMYWFGQQIGEAGPIPGLVEAMLARLTADEDGVARFMRVLNHDLAPAQVFHVGLLALGLGDALRAGASPRRQVLRDAWGLMRTQATQTVLGTRAQRRTRTRR